MGHDTRSSREWGASQSTFGPTGTSPEGEQASPTRRTIYYFAYGSNMSTGQMATRCPGAEFLGVARLDGWALRIDGRGVATIDAANDIVLGVLWSLTRAHEEALDRYEGVRNSLYRRQHLPLTGPVAPVTALVYVGNDRGRGAPRPGYLEILLEGAASAGLPEDYVAGIAALGGGSTAATC